MRTRKQPLLAAPSSFSLACGHALCHHPCIPCLAPSRACCQSSTIAASKHDTALGLYYGIGFCHDSDFFMLRPIVHPCAVCTSDDRLPSWWLLRIYFPKLYLVQPGSDRLICDCCSALSRTIQSPLVPPELKRREGVFRGG